MIFKSHWWRLMRKWTWTYNRVGSYIVIILPVYKPSCFPFDLVIHSKVQDISLHILLLNFSLWFFLFSTQKQPLFGTYYSLRHPFFESVTKSPETAARMTHELHLVLLLLFFSPLYISMFDVRIYTVYLLYILYTYILHINIY